MVLAILEEITMPLGPEENITKILLSTPSYFVGKYVDNDCMVSIVFDRTLKRDDALNHEYFIFSVKTPSLDRSQIPDYTALGDVLCIYLSILYGKRFDNHGLIESLGNYWLPNYLPSAKYEPKLPFNSQTDRPDLEIPRCLDEIRRIAPLLHEGLIDSRFENFLMSAGRFYLHALQQAETQPEIAFLDLITCGEIISYFYDYDQDELLDDKIKMDLSRIEKGIDGGSGIVRHIRGRLSSVKRRFVKTVLYLLNPYFFQQTEARWGSLIQADISKRIKAAYDLRSRYVHTGANFGVWIGPEHLRGFNNEILIGEPVIEDQKLKKILIKSPTLIGMERIMRFCLLRFMHLNGIFIDLRLEGKGLMIQEDEADEGDE
jgi:hypothetical protein